MRSVSGLGLGEQRIENYRFHNLWLPKSYWLRIAVLSVLAVKTYMYPYQIKALMSQLRVACSKNWIEHIRANRIDPEIEDNDIVYLFY